MKRIVMGLTMVLILGFGGYVFAGDLDSPGDPATAGRMYTLENIYYYLAVVDGGVPSKATGGFAEPLAGPVEITGTVDSANANSIVDADLAAYPIDSFKGWRIEITEGTGAGQTRDIIYLWSANTLFVSEGWDTVPAVGDTYKLTRPTLDDIFGKLVRLPATGQTTSYATGDDGDLQKGATLQYSYSDDGTIDTEAENVVTDLNTGLMWIRTPGLITGSGTGAGGNVNISTGMDWATALSQCNSLVYAGYSDWRMPNVKELVSIMDYARYNKAVDPNVFGLSIDYYWTSTTFPVDTTVAYNVESYYGRATVNKSLGDWSTLYKTDLGRVLPVRGGR